MTEHRAIIEMGMGTDLHGRDYAKAANRAIEHATRHATLALFRTARVDKAAARIVVTVGVQNPDAVTETDLTTAARLGATEVRITHGGLDVTDPATGATQVVASAAVEVFLPSQANRWR